MHMSEFKPGTGENIHPLISVFRRESSLRLCDPTAILLPLSYGGSLEEQVAIVIACHGRILANGNPVLDNF